MKVKRIIVFIVFIVCVFGQTALAMDLQMAKKQGLVGETATGYLAPVRAPSKDISQLVDKINGERRKLYKKIAKKNRTTLQAVEQLAGEKAIKKSRSGYYVKQGSSWQRK